MLQKTSVLPRRKRFAHFLNPYFLLWLYAAGISTSSYAVDGESASFMVTDMRGERQTVCRSPDNREWGINLTVTLSPTIYVSQSSTDNSTTIEVKYSSNGNVINAPRHFGIDGEIMVSVRTSGGGSSKMKELLTFSPNKTHAFGSVYLSLPYFPLKPTGVQPGTELQGLYISLDALTCEIGGGP
jgi:hypothetical protein